jgi:hypothetical protein
VSTPQPPRRRRIAGESKPGAPAPKTSVVKRAAKVRTPSKTPPPPKSPAPPKPPKAKASEVAAPEAPPRPMAESASTDVEQRTRRLRVRSMSGRFGALVALTVAALVFGAVSGFRGLGEWRDNSGIVEAHQKAATTAASAAETIFTYQYNKLGEHLSASKKTMTPAFAKKFTSIAPALQDLAPQRKIQVKATVRNAAAVECGSTCSTDAATILVFIDQARVADGADQPTVFGNRIEVSMVKREGAWLVDDVKAL